MVAQGGQDTSGRPKVNRDRASQRLSGHSMSARRIGLIGGLLVAIGPIAMSLYTPAMPDVVLAYKTTKPVVNMTLTLYFAGFAFAQLIAGALSDVLGRRPVTTIFMLIFCLASLAAFLSPTIETLIAARFFQGVGASAGIAISRAIVRDCFDGEESSRIMNMVGIILALGPAISPSLGGLLVLVFGWRSVFLVMILFGLVIVLVTSFGVQETLRTPTPLSFRILRKAYLGLLGNRHFMSSSLTIAGTVGAIYAQATMLPFVLMGQLHLTPSQFGLAMLVQSGFFFCGSLVVRRFMRTVGGSQLVVPGLGFIVLGAALVGFLFWESDPGVARIMVPIGIYAFGIAFVMPAMSTAALAPFPESAGAASSLMGFLQMVVGLIVGSLSGLFADALTAFSILIPAMAILACVSYAIYRWNLPGKDAGRQGG